MKGKTILALLLVSAVFAAGCVQQSGDITLPDGSIKKADGTIIKPNGVMIKPDGTMLPPEGSPPGTIVKEDGTVVKPDGTMIKPDGTMIGPEGKEEGQMMEKNETNGTMMEKTEFSGTVLAGSSAPVIGFNKADYDKAISSDKIVFLYFYATWCPICRAEVPEFYSAFNEIKSDKIVAFRVNFNDDDTDADEKALAQQFQVPYQHYKVILKDDKVVLRAPDTWNKARYLSEVNKVLV